MVLPRVLCYSCKSYLIMNLQKRELKIYIMKPGILFIAITIVFAACNTADKNKQKTTTTDSINLRQPAKTETKGTASIKEIVTGYLQIKNALANDNGDEAAKGGQVIADAIERFDTSSLSAEKIKAYTNVADDIKENATHIHENSHKIEHQREHFEMLTEDVYDLVNTLGSSVKLDKAFCPMYNDNKGAMRI